MLVKPEGYSWSAPCNVNLINSPSPSIHAHPPALSTNSRAASQQAHHPGSAPFSVLSVCPSLPVSVQGPGTAAVALELSAQVLDPVAHRSSQAHGTTDTGSQRARALPSSSPSPRTGRQRTQQTVLSLTSPLWAYNCTGMPMAIRTAPLHVLEHQQVCTFLA